MPASRQVRARQNRQRERIAVAQAERRRVLRQRWRLGAAGGAVVVVAGVIALLLATAGGGSSPRAVVTGKSCAGLRDTLPAGAPAMPLAAGPAPTKLTWRDLKVGKGAVVPRNAKVTVDYVGVACSTGKIFDSSYSRHQPFPADLAGGVIPGWIDGIPGMRIGGVRLLSIPSNLAYGSSGNPPVIGPDEPLYFLVTADKLG